MTKQNETETSTPIFVGEFDKDNWRERAACADLNDPTIFFAEKKGGKNAYFEARCICYSCPVQKNCLDFAVQNAEQHGLWGGLPYRERLKYANGQRSHRITMFELAKGVRGNKPVIQILAEKLNLSEQHIRNQIKKGRYKYGNR